MFGSRVARTWRGIAAAGLATFAAAVSHAAADGHPPPILGFLLASVVAVPVCIALAGRSLSWFRLSVAVLVSQFAFHGLLLLGVTDPAAMPSTSAMTGHVHEMQSVLSTATPLPAIAAHAGAGMWLAHAIAALVTIFAIGRGEIALRALAELSGWHLVARVLDWHPTPSTHRRPLAVEGEPSTFSTAFILSVVRRRGPPVTA